MLARLLVAVVGIALAFRIALPGGDGEDKGIARALVDAWQVPAVEVLLWFGLAWGILGVGLWLGAIRFRILLHGGGLDVPLPVLFRAYLVAAFVNLVLPGAILGDVYRFWDARRNTGQGPVVLGIVAVERVLSLAALGSIALAIAPAIPLIQDDRALLWLLVAAGATFVLAALAVLRPVGNRALRAMVRSFSPVLPRIAGALERALAAVAVLAASPSTIARAFALSLANQGLPVLALVVLAVPLDALVPWYWFAVIVPFVTLVSLFPISIGGAGVRELLYVALFGAVGMPAESALALSLSVFAAALLWGLLGLAVLLVGRSGRASSPAPVVAPQHEDGLVLSADARGRADR